MTKTVNAIAAALAASLLAGTIATPALADPREDRAERCAITAELCKERKVGAPRTKVNVSSERTEPRIGFDAPVMTGPFGSFQ